jgi:hypothetical protein
MPDRSQERWLASLAGEATPHPPKVSKRLQPSNSVGGIRLVRRTTSPSVTAEPRGGSLVMIMVGHDGISRARPHRFDGVCCRLRDCAAG